MASVDERGFSSVILLLFSVSLDWKEEEKHFHAAHISIPIVNMKRKRPGKGKIAPNARIAKFPMKMT